MGRNRREMMEQRSWKLNWRYGGMITIIGGASILGIKSMLTLILDSAAVGEAEKGFLIIFSLLGILWADFAIFGLSQFFSNRGQAFQLTKEGIVNAFSMEGFGPVFIWYKINLIPWEAVRGVYRDEGFYKLHLDVSKVKAGKFAKRHLVSDGYAFAYNWISPKMTKGDLEKYVIPHLHVKVNLKKGNWEDKEFGSGPRI